MIAMITAITVAALISGFSYIAARKRIEDLEQQIEFLKDKIEYLEETTEQTTIDDFKKMVCQDVKYGGF